MKTTIYRFEQSVQEATDASIEYLTSEFKAILESNKDFTRKCDYIGFSIASIDSKVASIDEELEELQELKNKLKLAKDIALRIGAQVFSEYGIDTLEGAGISSITLTKASTKMNFSIYIKDEMKLIEAGYAKLVIDERAIIDAFENIDENPNLYKYARFEAEDKVTPAKLKINKRRTTNTELEVLS